MAARDTNSTKQTDKTDAIEIKVLMKINPLIDCEEGTERVESVLRLISFLMLDATNGSITLDEDQAHGLAFMLETCEAALREMRHSSEIAA